MSATFAGYTDAFASAPVSTSSEEFNFRKLERMIRKLKQKNKKLKRTIKEQRVADEKRIAEEKRIADEKRTTDEAQNKEQSFLSKIGDAILKALPAVLTTIASILVKNIFSRRK